MAGKQQIPLFRIPVPPDMARGLGEMLAATVMSGQLAQGPRVAEFERALGGWLGESHVCATADAAGALTLALERCGVGPGTEVILSPMACVATVMPIANLGAAPAWCDTDPLTGMLDPSAVRAMVGPRTRAILAFHWAGDVCALDAIGEVAREAGVPLVSDASEALGARWHGRALGSHDADHTIYSFGPVRQLTAIEGGAIISARAQDDAYLRRARRYGIDGPSFRLPNGDLNPASDIADAGRFNTMNEIGATLALAQMDKVDAVIAAHRANADWFDQALEGVPGVTLLKQNPNAERSPWAYALRVQGRDALIARLRAEGIGCQRLHLRTDAYACFREARTGPQPGTDLFDRENLALPCGPWVDEAARERIAACLRAGW